MALYRVQPNGYGTHFIGQAANPLRDNGHWVQGGSDGVFWSDMIVSSGLAYGTQSAVAPGSGHPNYNDSIAHLTGAWSSNHAVEAKIQSLNQTDSAYCELELLLRCSISPNVAQLYECSWRMTNNGLSYCGPTRWNGAGSSYDSAPNSTGSGINNGDLIAATIRDNVITMWVNHVIVYTYNITSYPAGNIYYTGAPGMGHWNNANIGNSTSTGSVPNNGDWGFLTYRAWNL